MWYVSYQKCKDCMCKIYVGKKIAKHGFVTCDEKRPLNLVKANELLFLVLKYNMYMYLCILPFYVFLLVSNLDRN